MGKRITIQEKFDKFISKKGISVEEIFRELFCTIKFDKWPELMSLLKNKAKDNEKTRESKISLLTLYWLRYDEQTSGQNFPRRKIFLEDTEIPDIILEEGKKVLNYIKNGNITTANLEFLTYIIEALGDLDLNKVKSLKLLKEIKQVLLLSSGIEPDKIRDLNVMLERAIVNKT